MPKIAEKILIVTCSNEPNVKKVMDFLEKDSVFRLNTDRLLKDSTFSFCLKEGNVNWYFCVDGKTISAADIKAIWYRRPSIPKVSADISYFYKDFVENEAQKFLRFLWTTVNNKEIFWMNNPSAMRELERNKLRQIQNAFSVGLQTPESFITNSLDTAKEFFDRWRGEIVLKTFGGVPMIDSNNYLLAAYTSRVSREHLESFGSDIKYAPVFLQNYIPKDFELRITIVGNKIFSCAIYSQNSLRTKDDWRRYDFKNVKHKQYQLPVDIEEKLLKLMNLLGLNFGAIDMIVTPIGEYVFLEINPSGQWGWIERLTDMPISKAIAETLANPPNG